MAELHLTAPATLTDGIRRSAVLSDDGRYRYRLGRTWHNARPGLCWVMLNPSTADALVDDPTIRKCIRYSDSWGYGSIDVVNLYVYRTPSVVALHRLVSDGTGMGAIDAQAAKDHLLTALDTAADVMVAWGAKGARYPTRWRTVLEWIYQRHMTPRCIGRTANGMPKHPARTSLGLRRRIWTPPPT